MKIRYHILSLLCIALFFACDASIGYYHSLAGGLQFSVWPSSKSISSDGVGALSAYVFEHGILTDILSDVAISDGGNITINKEYSHRSELYFLGNTISGQFNAAINAMTPGETTLEEFQELMVEQTYSEGDNAVQPLFVGYEMATDISSSGSLQMDRAFAYIDLEIDAQEDGEISISSMKFTGLSKYVAPFNNNYTIAPTSAATTSHEIIFDEPVTVSQKDLFQINQGYYESAISVVIEAVIAGVPTQLVRSLPNSISGKNRYVVRALSNGAGGVTINPFDEYDAEDEDLESNMPAYVYINTSSSSIPSSVTLSGDSSTLYIPFNSAVDMTLQLACLDSGYTLALESPYGDDITITSLGSNRFRIKVNKAYINAHTELWNLAVTDSKSGLSLGNISFERDGHPIRFSGPFVDYITSSETFAAPTFIDGEMLEVSSRTEGYSFELEGDWVRFEPNALVEGRYVVQGGWKPNDVDAKGQTQSASLWVLDSSGARIIEYPMSRINYTLPVVYINGLWWAKFNLRGDRTKFEDQILLSNPLASVDLYEYLQTCSYEQFVEVVGSAYQSTHTNELTLTKRSSGDGFYLEGMTGGPRINTAAAGSLSPGGFQLPVMEQTETHLPWFGNWATSPAISENYAAQGGFNNVNDNSSRYRFRAYRRTTMSHDGITLPYGYMEVTKLVSSASMTETVDDSIVWMSLGHATSAAEDAYNSAYYYYAISEDVRMRHLGTDTSIFYLWCSSGMSDAVTYTHRCIKTPNDFILE